MSWRSDSMSAVTVWNGAVVASAAPRPTSPVGATGAGTRTRDSPAPPPHDVEQVRVGHDVGGAEVDRAGRAVVGQSVGDRAQHVGGGHRLDRAAHPRRHGLHEEQRRDLPDDLERRRPGPDHDARAQRDRAVGRAEEDALDLEPRRDVRRQVGLGHLRHQPGEVDEASYAAPGHCGCDGLGRHPVAVAEVAAVERVHEVDDGVDVLDRLRDGGGIGDVAADRTDPVVPAEALGPRRRRRRGHDVVPVASRWGTRREPM